MKNIYPIGTIVKITDIEDKFMVIGYLQQTEADEKVWDYVAVPFPQGFFGPEENLLFDEEQVAEVVSEGYQDDEQAEFKSRVEEFLKENM